jgi:hypothetical protein
VQDISGIAEALGVGKGVTDGMFTEQFLLADRGVVEKRTVNIPSVNAF